MGRKEVQEAVKKKIESRGFIAACVGFLAGVAVTGGFKAFARVFGLPLLYLGSGWLIFKVSPMIMQSHTLQEVMNKPAPQQIVLYLICGLFLIGVHHAITEIRKGMKNDK